MKFYAGATYPLWGVTPCFAPVGGGSPCAGLTRLLPLPDLGAWWKRLAGRTQRLRCDVLGFAASFVPKIVAGGKAVGSQVVRTFARAGGSGGGPRIVPATPSTTEREGSEDDLAAAPRDWLPVTERAADDPATAVVARVRFAAGTYRALLSIVDGDPTRLPEALRTAIVLTCYLRDAKRSGADITICFPTGEAKEVDFESASTTATLLPQRSMNSEVLTRERAEQGTAAGSPFRGRPASSGSSGEHSSA